MKDKVLVCELPALADGETRQRIQLYPGPGDYVHPAHGPFSLTADDLAEYADDINARGDRIALDYDHSPERGNGTRAAGWFVPGSAQVEDDQGVTAEVDWTPAAAEAIRNREYRFISPTFSFVNRDMHGNAVREPKQVGAALTNRPFFNVMEPLAADELSLNDALGVEDVFGADVADTLTEISADAARALIAAAAVKKPYGKVAYADPGYRNGQARYPIDTEEHVRAAWSYINQKRNSSKYTAEQIARIKARIKRAATKFGVTIGADETTKEKTMELTEAFAADLGVAVDASDEEVLAAMQSKMTELKAAAKPAEGTVTITADELAELKANAEKGAKAAEDVLETAITTELDARIGDFSIAASERDYWAGQLKRDFAATQKHLREKPKAVSLAPAGHAHDLKVGETVVQADTSPVMIDGVETPVDEDRAKVAAATEQHLRNQGKDPKAVTADEYAAAALAVAADPNLALSLA